MKRILRSGVVKMGRVSNFLAMKKPQKAVYGYADYFDACTKSIEEMVQCTVFFVTQRSSMSRKS